MRENSDSEAKARGESSIAESEKGDKKTLEERLEESRNIAKLIDIDQKPLNRALTEANKKHGVTFAGGNIGVWGLVHCDRGFTYPHLIDTLIDHFQRPYMIQNKEWIARALICKEAKNTEAPVVLMKELKKLHLSVGPEASCRWAIIYALSFIGDTRQVEETKKLIEDERYADVREDLEKMLAKIQKRKWKPKKSEA
jgi:hypothetical protein